MADADKQRVNTTELADLEFEYHEVDLLLNKERITSGWEYPLNDLAYDKESVAYVRGEDEPFTGLAFQNIQTVSVLSRQSFLDDRKHGNSIQYSYDGFIQRIEQSIKVNGSAFFTGIVQIKICYDCHCWIRSRRSVEGTTIAKPKGR